MVCVGHHSTPFFPEKKERQGMGRTIAMRIARSPNVIEVFVGYGITISMILVASLAIYEIDPIQLAWLIAIGATIYTFLEYWFHRFVLHQVFSDAHENHHKNPRILRFIATPFVPVVLLGFTITVIFIKLLGHHTAFGIHCGIALGQMTMDSVHICLHQSWRPWFLESARSYHMHHHFVKENRAIGITTTFWDLIFGTLPTQWQYYKRYPYLQYIHLPFPILTFALIGLMSGDAHKGKDNNEPLESARWGEGFNVESFVFNVCFTSGLTYLLIKVV